MNFLVISANLFAQPEIATVIEGLEEKAKSAREIFEKACDIWLEACTLQRETAMAITQLMTALTAFPRS